MLTTFNAILVEEANRLDGDLYTRSIHTSPWIDLVDTGAFPDGIGDVVSTMVWERTLPGSSIVWKNMMGADNGSSDTILPPTQTVSTAKRLQEYRLQHTSLESDTLNVNDLRTAVIRDAQLSAIRDNLSTNTNYLWFTRARQEYDRLTKHVALVAAGNVESASGGSADTTSSDLVLSNNALTRYRQRMIRMQAAPLDRVNGAPIFGLICDSEVSDALRSEVSIAEALKHDGRANELLAPLGVEKAYKNFFHIVDDLAPRYTFSSGVYTEVLPYTTEAADPANGKFGIRLIENTAYETATHTRSYIFQRDVYKMLYPNTVTSAAAGVTFDPVMYRGDWKWLNVVNVDKNSTAYNPDGTIGFFRGVFASATKAIKPEQGFTVIHKRPGV
jgi:hypothetical protein